MRVYGDIVFPWLMETLLSRPVYRRQRKALLRQAGGRVLEIGFGFGGSLGEYPAGRVKEIVALEPNPGMIRRARPRIDAAGFPVRFVRGVAERLPFRDRRFDTVVTHWTLCSLRGLPAGLGEIRRVLHDGGRFLFLEHGLAAEPGVARWQRRLTPIQRVLADGCRLDLDIEEVVRSGGFRLESIERYESELPLRVLRQMYRGVARPL